VEKSLVETFGQDVQPEDVQDAQSRREFHPDDVLLLRSRDVLAVGKKTPDSVPMCGPVVGQRRRYGDAVDVRGVPVGQDLGVFVDLPRHVVQQKLVEIILKAQR
jgi:hypothetical protein